ncbi:MULTISPECIES: lycopene cyclase family protein [Halomonadaceae]|uniref:Lycopene cyclase n=1 Tax=Vreelandella halophila TaxID=86177 RepID=A0A9X4Y8J9_9GAMM|nr:MULTISPECIES: lycopene cyclase family protein [Halomonas]MYL25326.1 lycopene cyclase [Halomonas utahensis]MYL75201.1 lycopene cyclase [Halomonas sp. 22501_18_FS]
MAPGTAPDHDLIIVGAGLTGLSLACWLKELSQAHGQRMPNVRLLEPRTTYTNDRTWCFWDRMDHPFRELITHRWRHWQVSSGQQRAIQSSDLTPYALLPADRLYRHALACIDACQELTLEQGARVSSVEEEGSGARVITDAGQLRARAVVDTRMPASLPGSSVNGFWQVFTGLEIECRHHGYDTTTARLMDFQACPSHPCFVYLLPLDEHHLMVEWTAFRTERDNRDTRSQLEQWLDRAGINDYRVLRSESSLLPMIPMRRERGTGRVIRAGVGAGWMRAATGYHFASCQRGTRHLAEQILAANQRGQWHLRPPTLRARWLEWMDRVFLRALRRHPDRAPEWFLALFAGTTAAQMSRFMNDEPGPGDALAIAGALPPAPFLRAALS